MTRLFLYGTLLDDALREMVGGGAAGAFPGAAAKAEGCRVCHEQSADLPFLTRAEGRVARGILTDALSPEALARFDAYELGYDYERAPLRVDVAGRVIDAEAYFGGPNLCPTDADWEFAEWKARDGGASVLAAEELFAHDPPLSGAEMARQWPMLMMRAHSRLRAGNAPAPARGKSA